MTSAEHLTFAKTMFNRHSQHANQQTQWLRGGYFYAVCEAESLAIPRGPFFMAGIDGDNDTAGCGCRLRAGATGFWSGMGCAFILKLSKQEALWQAKKMSYPNRIGPGPLLASRHAR